MNSGRKYHAVSGLDRCRLKDNLTFIRKIQPQKILEKASGFYLNGNKLLKLSVLTAATIFLVIRCAQFLKPFWRFVFSVDLRQRAHWIVHIDFLIWTVVALSFLILLALIFSNKKVFDSLYKRFPMSSSVLSASFVFSFILFTPYLMVYRKGPAGICGIGFNYFSSEKMGYLWPHFLFDRLSSVNFSSFLINFNYVKIVALLAFSVSLLIYEITDEKKSKWRGLVYLILPFPLVWLFAFVRIFPSTYWKIWKPVLIIIACLSPVIAFFSFQPIVNKYPVYATKNVQRIESYNQYQIVRAPDRAALYIGWNNEGVICEKGDSSWNSNRVTIPVEADEGSFDFQRELIYVFDAERRKLDVFDMESLKIVSAHPVPEANFPVKGEHIRQAFDPEKKKLFIAHKKGYLMRIDTNNFEIEQSIFFNAFGTEIWRLHLDPERGELFVLSSMSIYVLRTDDLSLIRQAHLPAKAFDMELDLPRNRILVGLPSAFRLLSINRETMKIQTSYRVPAGIRALAIDEERKLLFLGYISGLLEIRSLSDFQLINQVRLIPWLRRIAVIPETGTLAANGRGCPVFWQYDQAKNDFDPGITTLRALDWAGENVADSNILQPLRRFRIFQ